MLENKQDYEANLIQPLASRLPSLKGLGDVVAGHRSPCDAELRNHNGLLVGYRKREHFLHMNFLNVVTVSSGNGIASTFALFDIDSKSYLTMQNRNKAAIVYR